LFAKKRIKVMLDNYLKEHSAPEDCEYYYRLQALGYKVGRVNDIVYHLEHSRTFNSHYHNPKFMDNHNLWQNIRTWDRDTITRYYESQNYIKERRSQLNVSV
jgi:Na+-transporting NADH:ubiquinone oxidoreductase subunit NqrF